MDIDANVPHFVLLACDGLWDVCTNTGAVGLVASYIKNGWNAEKISKVCSVEGLLPCMCFFQLLISQSC